MPRILSDKGQTCRAGAGLGQGEGEIPSVSIDLAAKHRV